MEGATLKESFSAARNASASVLELQRALAKERGAAAKKDKEIDELKRLAAAQKQRHSILEQILLTKQEELKQQTSAKQSSPVHEPTLAKLEPTLEEEPATPLKKKEELVPQTPAPRDSTFAITADLRVLRLSTRKLRTEARAARRQDFMMGGGLAFEMVADWATLCCGNGTALQPRGLQLTADAQRLLVAAQPHGASPLFDRLLRVSEVVAVEFGTSHAQCARRFASLAPRQPAPWRCFSVVLAAGGPAIHLVAPSDDAAIDWVLGLRAICHPQADAAPPPPPDAGAAAPADGLTYVPRTAAPFRPPRVGDAGASCTEGQLLWERARMRLGARAHSEGRSVRSLVVAAVRARAEEISRA